MLLVPVVLTSSARAQSGVAAANKPSISVTPTSAAPGSVVLVTLERWPEGAVNVSICGNDALRGSQDCDQISTAGMAVRDGTALVRLLVPTPPVGCPCVVRAATPNNGFAQTTRLEVPGIPMTPPLRNQAGPASSKTLEVTAVVRTPSAGLGTTLQALFAGPASRELAVTITNHGDQEVDGLRVVGAVGRRRTDAEPIGSREVGALVAGESRRVVVPFSLSTPAWGGYAVFGSVYGSRSPIRYSARTGNDPWLLQVALPIILLVLARIERRRQGRRRLVLVTNTAPSDFEGGASGIASTLPQGSSVVPNRDDERWPTPVYDPAVNGRSRAPHERAGRRRSRLTRHAVPR